MSLHMNNYDKKRRIGKKLLHTVHAMMLEEHVDLVAVDFNGAPNGNNSQPTSILEEEKLWGPGAVPGEEESSTTTLRIQFCYCWIVYS